MSLEQAILEAIRALPAEKQQEVLNHADKLRGEEGRKMPFKSVRGLWADLSISLSAKEIEENQQDMWRNSHAKTSDACSCCRYTQHCLVPLERSAPVGKRGRCPRL